MNNKGYAITGLLYTSLVVLATLMISMLMNMQNRKNILTQLKIDAVEAVDSVANINLILKQLTPEKIFVLSHPVGSIYITVSEDESTVELMNAKYEKSTWESYGEGRVLVGAGTGKDNNNISKDFAINSTGGEYSHQLTVPELPSHSHPETGSISTLSYMKGLISSTNLFSSSHDLLDGQTTGSTGDNVAHNNIQPYVTVYMWKRVA